MAVGGDAIQRDLERLERWAVVSLLKFNKEKCKVLFLVQANTNYPYVLGDEWIESSIAEKDMGVLVFEDLDMSWQGALAAQKAKFILCCMKRGGNDRSRQVIPPTAMLLCDPTCITASSSGAPVQERHRPVRVVTVECNY